MPHFTFQYNFTFYFPVFKSNGIDNTSSGDGRLSRAQLLQNIHCLNKNTTTMGVEIEGKTTEWKKRGRAPQQDTRANENRGKGRDFRHFPHSFTTTTPTTH